jgi:hypothetical protein
MEIITNNKVRLNIKQLEKELNKKVRVLSEPETITRIGTDGSERIETYGYVLDIEADEKEKESIAACISAHKPLVVATGNDYLKNEILKLLQNSEFRSAFKKALDL